MQFFTAATPPTENWSLFLNLIISSAKTKAKKCPPSSTWSACEWQYLRLGPLQVNQKDIKDVNPVHTHAHTLSLGWKVDQGWCTGQMLFPYSLFPSSFWRFKVIFFFPEESLTWKRSIIVFWLVAVAIPALFVEERSCWTISTRAIYWFWKYTKFHKQVFVQYCCDHKNTLLIPDQTAYSLYLKMKHLAYCTRQIFCILSLRSHFSFKKGTAGRSCNIKHTSTPCSFFVLLWALCFWSLPCFLVV